MGSVELLGASSTGRPMARLIRRGKAIPAILVPEVEGTTLRNQLAISWSAYTVWLCVRQPQEENRQEIDRLTRVLRHNKLSSTQFDEVSREQ